MGSRKNTKSNQLLEAEYGHLPKLSGDFAVAVVYPNTYYVAMSNLAFQWLYQALNANASIRAERLVLPPNRQAAKGKSPQLQTLETNRPAGQVAAWFVTLPFENDYSNLVRMLRMADIDPLAADRKPTDPVIIAGGTGPMLNPEPLAPIVDAFVLGEGRLVLDPVLSKLLKEDEIQDFLESLKDLPFVYVPKYYQVKYDENGNRNSVKATKGFIDRPRIQREESIRNAGTYTRVLTKNTEFGDNFLIEIFRGCSARCRFCAAGHISLPPRERDFAREFLPDLGQKAVGLVGAGVSAHTQLSHWMTGCKTHNRIGISSLRMNTVSDENLGCLAQTGAKSLAIAPEAGSKRLRKVCNKPFTDKQIVGQAKRVIDSGFINLKLYFMVGLPTETSLDIQSIIDLTLAIKKVILPIWRQRKMAGNISVSVNPFIPKANTPFQWAPFISRKNYQSTRRRIMDGLKKEGNIKLRFESYRSSRVQAVLSMGDQNAAQLIMLLASEPNETAAFRKWEVDPDSIISVEREFDQILPWDFIDSGISRVYLQKEYQKGLDMKISPECLPDSCRLCGICD